MEKSFNTLNIAFGINNKYSKYIRVITYSICVNNPQSIINFHILTDFISKRNISKIKKNIEQFKNAKIFIHHIDINFFKDLYLSTWNISTWYRILLPKVLDDSIDKVLYLDADTIVNGDLRCLFEMDLKDKSIAAVHDLITFAEERKLALGIPQKDKYICAGVMMLNLVYWRKNNLAEKILKYARDHASILVCPNQDPINAICHDTIKLLPFKYGYVREFYNKKDSIIFHYSSTYPWQTIYKPPHYLIWKKYNDQVKYPVRTKWNNLILFFKINLYPIKRLLKV